MNRIIRKSIPQDAQHFVKIKNELPFPSDKNNSKKGGFLLGTDIETYKFYIENGNCLTALTNNKIIGFGIVLPNSLVKKSALWEKRKSANWTIDLNDLETSNISYFEQLAFVKRERISSIRLAYNLVKSAFSNGAEYILTTTVNKPIINLASLPYIIAVGGKKIGTIEEVYPVIGNIDSDIYLIEKKVFHEKIKQVSVFNRLEPNDIASKS